MKRTHEQPTYTYTPLPGNDFIRVLELKPSMDKDAPLHGSLQIARLGHDDYPYDAMSYTWGEPVLSQTLYLEATPPNQDSPSGGLHPVGKKRNFSKMLRNMTHLLHMRSLWDSSSGGLYSIEITPNLSKMLRHMRHPLRTRRLWVDALCINQKDGFEKSHQIPLMFRIYQQASEVVIWLGDSIEDQKRMRLLSIFARRRVQHDGSVSTMSCGYVQAAQEAIYRLTEIPWFSRLWVVQEAVVNTDVTMYCGDEKMSLVRLFDIVKDIHSLSKHQPARLQSLLEMRNLWNEYARGHASDVSSGRCNGERPCALVDIMEKFEHFGCADPRDRVYAISNLEKCIGIGPNYRLSPEEIFTIFACSMRDHGQLQWVLREAAIRQRGKRTPGLPSWVPDLSTRPIRRPIFATHLEIHGEYIGDAIDVSTSRQEDGNDAICLTNWYWDKNYHTSVYPHGSRSWHHIWIIRTIHPNDYRHITSTRLRFDPWPMIATWRGDSFPDQPEPAEAIAWIKTTLELAWQQVSERAAKLPSDVSKRMSWRDCMATVASTLVAGGAHIRDLQPSTSKEVQELSAAIPNIYKNHSTSYGSGNSFKLFTTCLQELVEDTVNKTSMADAFLRLVIITMQGRCFFTSDIDEDEADDQDQAVIACGIGPSHMQIGDQALLHYMPFWEQAYLMRACGRIEEQSISCFELVGDCYLKEPVAGAYELDSIVWRDTDAPTTEQQRTIILK